MLKVTSNSAPSRRSQITENQRANQNVFFGQYHELVRYAFIYLFVDRTRVKTNECIFVLVSM